jgi:hypothetical protein
MAGHPARCAQDGLEASARSAGRKVVAGNGEKRADGYRRKAEQYRGKAGKASGEHDKTAWLKLAEDWQQLADVFRQRAPDNLPACSYRYPRARRLGDTLGLSTVHVNRTLQALRAANLIPRKGGHGESC